MRMNDRKPCTFPLKKKKENIFYLTTMNVQIPIFVFENEN